MTSSLPCGCRLGQLCGRCWRGHGSEVGVCEGLCCCYALPWVKRHEALQQVQGTRGCLQEQQESVGVLQQDGPQQVLYMPESARGVMHTAEPSTHSARLHNFRA